MMQYGYYDRFKKQTNTLTPFNIKGG